MKKLLLFLSLLMLAGCAVTSSSALQNGPQKAERKPLQKSLVKIQAPTLYERRERLTKNGKVVTYDPKPQFMVVDEKAGKYELRWIGYDGKQKIISYQRADAIDLIVKAEVSKSNDEQYQYKYDLYNLPSSPTYISSFLLQTFAIIAPDPQLVKLSKQNKLYMGGMSETIPRFRAGYWRTFHQLDETTHIQPGQHFTIQFTASAPPGLVDCTATGGQMTLRGVGEHIPFELESAMPGYEEYPSGQTIGPVDSLTKMTQTEKGQYVLERLAQFREAGWLTDYARQEYAKLLQASNYEVLLARLDKDLQDEQITSEVYSIMQILKAD